VCADCGTGFAPHHRRCPVCGSARLGPDRGKPSRVAPTAPGAAEPTRGGQELLRAVPAGWARELAEALAQAGVPHRVEVMRASPPDGGTPTPPEYAIWIRPEDLEAAARIDAAVFRRHVPESGEAAPREIERPGLDARGLAVRVLTLLVLSAILMLLTQLFGRR
jgi:hypothetical protein